MNNCIDPLHKLDHFTKQNYLHAVQTQLIPNRFREWADMGCSSPVSLQTLRFKPADLNIFTGDDDHYARCNKALFVVEIWKSKLNPEIY